MKANKVRCSKNRAGKEHIPQETAEAKKAKRRREAEERQARRDKLTDAQQLAIIAERRGESKKETARLRAAIENTPDSAEVAKPGNMNRVVMSKKKQKRCKRRGAKKNGK